MYKYLLSFIILLFSSTLFAQTGSVKGFVYDKENGEPILFTPVFLNGTSYGTTTDINGFYTITRVPIGNYTLTCTAIGYDSVSIKVSVTANGILTKQLYLNKGTINLKAVDISAEKQEQRTEVQVSVTKITPKELKMVPSVGGEPDLAQYLQILPGVVFSGDQGGQLYIRGGTPVMNKILLDGMIIYNPFHSIGLFSVFDTDVMKNADVYTGGFSAEYGDRISAVMDVTTRDGNKKQFSGKFSATTFGAKVLVEGPLKKQKNPGDNSTTFIFSYKNSYLDKTSQTFYEYANEDGLPYSFSDLYSKISFNGENGSKISIFGFNFQDDALFQNIANISWKANGFGSNFVLVPKGSNNLIDGIFAYSKYNISQQEANEKPRTSAINGFNLGINFTSYYARDEMKFGFEVLGFRTEYESYGITNVKAEQIENTTEFGTFLKYKITRDKLVIEPSFRLQYYASLSEISPEPRIGVKWNVSDHFRLKGAAGMYSQNLMSTSSDRDVVNLFYGFLSGPESLPKEFRGKTVTGRLQKSRDIIVGFESDPFNHFSINVEAYYKYFPQITNSNRNKVYPDNGSFPDQPDYLVKDYIVESGEAYGIDFVLKYEFKRIYLWFVYSLGNVSRTDEIQTYSPHYNRQHNLNLVGSYTFGKNLNWLFNARWNYGSGFPFTKTAGYYEYQNFQNGLYTNINTENGYLGLIYGGINEGKLPDYHRLDLSLQKTFEIGKKNSLQITASVINVYNRSNIFYFDRIRYKRVDQLPALPSLGVSLTF